MLFFSFPVLATTFSLLHLASAAPTPLVDNLPSSSSANDTLISSFAALEKRQTCKTYTTCKNKLTITNSGRACVNGVCTWSCKKGYVQVGSNTCVRPGTASTVSSVKLAAVSSNLNGVSRFSGTQTGAIASWYHTNSAADSTNGHSWCYYPYNDATPGFAISLASMLADAGGDATKARQMYCGLEAIVTTPSGKTVTLYVADAFDDAWVRTPSSMDVVYNSFSKLFGKTTSNKNDVVQNVSWKFTGNKSAQYSYASTGN